MRRFRNVAYGAVLGAARGGYAAYRDAYDPAAVAGDALTQILRAAGANQQGAGGATPWNAVVSGLTNAFLNQYDTITIATNATPPVTVNLRDALASGPPNPVARWLQPTVVLSGPAGQQMVAPYGASSGSHGGPVFLVLALFGLGYVFGKLS